jgi:hypothetical protein
MEAIEDVDAKFVKLVAPLSKQLERVKIVFSPAERSYIISFHESL